MTDLRTAAQQALEYMKSVGQADMYPEEWAIVGRLEAALAQQAEAAQEPVAWYYERDTDKGLSFAPDRDPYKCWQPLTTPRPQRKPLTDEEIDAIGKALLGAGYGGNTDREFARAVERAHGIGEKK